MKQTALRTALAAALLIVPELAAAGVALSPMMQSWNHYRHQIDVMLANPARYDEATISDDLDHFAADAANVANHVRGGSPEARDFSRRFAGFATDGRSALTSVGQPAVFRARFRQMVGECQSCHSEYNN